MKTRSLMSLTVLAALLVWAALMFMAAPAVATHTTLTTTVIPAAEQSLARFLWGSMATDYWTHTSTGQDSLSYKFIFLNADSTDTLRATPSAVVFSTSVVCTLTTHGPAGTWIDIQKQVLNTGESVTLGARVAWIHVGNAGAGVQRAWAFAD